METFDMYSAFFIGYFLFFFTTAYIHKLQENIKNDANPSEKCIHYTLLTSIDCIYLFLTITRVLSLKKENNDK